jgi:predicted TIM-barrel fold metal-dependent hydrolase
MIIDSDTHFFPRDAFEHVDDCYAGQKPRLKLDENGILIDIEFPGQPARVAGTTPLPAPGSGSGYKGNNDIKARLADYARMGIDRQLLTGQFTGWWSYLIEPKLAGSMVHSWNLAVLRLTREYPGAIDGVALVALQDLPGAIHELEWSVENGFRAVVLDHTFPVWEHPYGTPTAAHREVWPFFQRCEALDVPVVFHAVQHGHRIVNLLSFQRDGLDFFAPTDAQMNLVALMTTGLLDEFPELKIVHAEMGTKNIKPLAQRLDAQFRRVPVSYEEDEGATAVSRRKLNSRAPQLVPPEEAAEKNKLAPSEYFRRNFYWTIETEEPELVEAIEFLGAEHFLFATDYPHDDPGGKMKFKDVELLAKNERISERDKERIRCGNAAELFHLD